MANIARNVPAATPAPVLDKKELKKLKKAEKAENRVKKGITPVRAALLVFVFMLFLSAAATACVYFDVLNSRQIVVNLLLEGKSPYQPQIDKLEQLSRSLAQESLALEAERADLEDREKQAEKTEKTIAAREKALKTKEAQLENLTAGAQVTQTNTAQLVTIYEKMDAAKAAAIMEEMYDVEDIARLFSGMKQDKAAAILAAISSEKAARITELMLE